MEIIKSVIDEIPEEIYRVLDEIGVPAHMKAYDYIAYASTLLINDTTHRICVTQDIYPEISKEFNTSYSCVERAIRTAINYVFSNTDPELLFLYFGNSVPLNKSKVPNSQFVYTVARIARRQLIKS